MTARSVTRPPHARPSISLDLDFGGGIYGIDTLMHGYEGITAVYYLPGRHPAIIDTGPGSSAEHVLQRLEEGGVTRLDWIVLTHIHLDHAGAAGHIAARYPKAKVVVREEGAPHLVNPERLWASASRIYEDMTGLWGEMIPVPEERVVAVAKDGPVASLGDRRQLVSYYAPGHAKHQMALLESSNGDLFTGDAIGVRLPDAGVIRPATPPPEFDLSMTLETIERLRRLEAKRVFPTHFGPVPEPQEAFDEAALRFRQWVDAAEEARVAGGGLPEIVEALQARRERFYPKLDPRVIEKFEHAASYDMNARGILRYLDGRSAAVATNHEGLESLPPRR